MSPTEIDGQISGILDQIRPLQSRLDTLYARKREVLSKAFISANGVTLDNIETSETRAGRPYFPDLTSFLNWMRIQPEQKRFMEWNTVIYFTHELLANKMDRDAPGRLEHVLE